MNNTAFFDPTLPPSINLPPGFTASVFVSGLNAPTGIAFLGNASSFQVFVLESGHGLPSVCNDEIAVAGWCVRHKQPLHAGHPGIQPKRQRRSVAPWANRHPTGGGFQPSGPAIDIAFVNGLSGGRLFATDSNQSTHQHNGQNNSSRIVTVNPMTGLVTPFITNLPTGDHPTEQLAFRGDGWIYWSQGSTTNSGVVGLDNGGGQNQSDIPCQDITLSQNVFISSFGPPEVATSGYSPFGVQQPGGHNTGVLQLIYGSSSTGGLRRRDLASTTEQSEQHSGLLLGVSESATPSASRLMIIRWPGESSSAMDGADERGARPSNNAPEELHLGRQNPDGSPDYHGWPDRYGGLPTSQAVYNPVGGPNDDVCPPPFDRGHLPCEPSEGERHSDPRCAGVPTATDHRAVGARGGELVVHRDRLRARCFCYRIRCRPGAALYSLEGDFGFSAPNATAPAPEVGHEVKLINFNQVPGSPLALRVQNFARNSTGDQAFVTNINGFNRPTNVRFGPDGCAYVVDYGAVRDLSADSHFVGPPPMVRCVQIPGTGVIWKICPM